MRYFKLVPLTILALLALCFNCQNDEPSSNPTEIGFSFDQSDCLTAKAAYRNDFNALDNAYLKTEFDHGTLIVTLVALYWNCCPEFTYTTEVIGNVINITVKDDAEDHCRCMCHFDLTTNITALTPGEYTINYILNYEWQGMDVGEFDTLTKQFTVPELAQAKAVKQDTWSQQSDCYTPSEMNVQLDQLNFFTSTDAVQIIHYAIYNCAAIILSEYEKDGYLIKIFETETNNIANCICDYELEYNFSNLVPGTYTVEVWDGSRNTLLAKGNFTL